MARTTAPTQDAKRAEVMAYGKVGGGGGGDGEVHCRSGRTRRLEQQCRHQPSSLFPRISPVLRTHLSQRAALLLDGTFLLALTLYAHTSHGVCVLFISLPRSSHVQPILGASPPPDFHPSLVP